MSAIDQTMVSNILNATTPTKTGGLPAITFWTAGGLAAAAMLLRLTSTTSSPSAAGTTLAGSGSGDYSITTASTASSAGSAVVLPNVSGGTGGTTFWTNGSGGAWSIASCELQGGGNVRAWFGNFTGQPISVAIGNSFEIAQNAVSVSLT